MRPPAPFGFNVIGYVSGYFGEAVVSRNTIRALLASGHQVAVRDVPTGDSRSGHDHTYDHLAIHSPFGQPLAVNLFHVNPPTFERNIGLSWLGMRVSERTNVMVPFWELNVVPERWKNALRFMDAVLAPSHFIAQTLRNAMPDLRIIHFPQAVYLPDDVSPERDRWRLADEEVVFLLSFDVTSDIHRKNPWAAIEAFLQAFPRQQAGGVKTRLLVKLNHANVVKAHAHLVDRLRNLAAADQRIRLIDERLTYHEVLSLYASADVVVSLHRAEGLGLVLMEAMSLGKPVIATAYSGNMDFTTPANSALVKFEMVPVDGSHCDYSQRHTGAGAVWADPDVASAADWMVRLASDADLRLQLGQQAAADMEVRRQEHQRGAVFAEVRQVADAGRQNEQSLQKARILRDLRRRGLMRLFMRALRRLVVKPLTLVIRSLKILTSRIPSLEARRRSVYNTINDTWLVPPEERPEAKNKKPA